MKKTKTACALLISLLLLAIPTLAAWLMAGFAGLHLHFLVPAIGAALVVLAGRITYCLDNKVSCKKGAIILGSEAAAFLLCLLGERHYRLSYLPSITVAERSLSHRDYLPFTDSPHLVSLGRPPALQFSSAQELPVVDGATAMFPLYCSFVENTYPKDCNIREFVHFSTTEGAYENLIKGGCDIIFAGPPSRQQLLAAQEQNLEFALHPIGHEAFVFIVNEENPVSNITVQQAKDIYTGNITNWKELGGKNQPIRPFQREENSGSQTAFLAIMGNDENLISPEIRAVAGMDGLVDVVADYQNHGNALGYSFRYFVETMKGTVGIKILSLNGIPPTKQNIRNKTYPVTGNFYAITIHGRESENTRKFIDWIVSAEGQEIVEHVGYVPLFE